MTQPENERIAVLETKVNTIELQVTNHIPTAIASLDTKVDKINQRIAYAAGAIAVIVAIVNIAIAKWGG